MFAIQIINDTLLPTLTYLTFDDIDGHYNHHLVPNLSFAFKQEHKYENDG